MTDQTTSAKWDELASLVLAASAANFHYGFHTGKYVSNAPGTEDHTAQDEAEGAATAAVKAMWAAFYDLASEVK